jgi:hypothetical protein
LQGVNINTIGSLEILIEYVQTQIAPLFMAITTILGRVGTKLAILMVATMEGIVTVIIIMVTIILAIISTKVQEKVVMEKEFLEHAIKRFIDLRITV